MTPFQRLGLYTASAIVVGAIAWVTQNVGVWVGASALVGGAILAGVATFELQQTLPPDLELEEGGPSEEQRREVLRSRDRAAIVKDAVAAREEARER